MSAERLFLKGHQGCAFTTSLRYNSLLLCQYVKLRL
jgi:hypothetical protein